MYLYKGCNPNKLNRILSESLAIEAYKWILKLSTKGKVMKKAREEGSVKAWEEARDNLSKDTYYLRLWKGVSTFYTERCEWCSHFGIRGKCQKRTCSYKLSRAKAARLFNVDRYEILFIHNNLSAQEEKEFCKFLEQKVKYYIPFNLEKDYHTRIGRVIFNRLSKLGHIRAKIYRSRFLKDLVGTTEDDIKAEMEMQLVFLIKKYDYLDLFKLQKVCATSLNNYLNNILSSFSMKKRSDLKRVALEEAEDILSTEPFYADPETLAIKNNLKETVLRLLRDTDGELKIAMEILLGRENTDFISFLKEKGIVNRRISNFSAFYEKTDPHDLMNMVNLFSGQPIDKYLKAKVERREEKGQELKNVNISSTNKKEITKKGGSMMNGNDNLRERENLGKTKISVPKSRCVLCGYWVPWLKKQPEDCSPAFPGCPISSFYWKKEFPIEQAANQLIGFLEDGDNVATQEFAEMAPNITDIINRALEILMDAEMAEDEESPQEREPEAVGAEEESVEGDMVEEEEEDIMVVGQIEESSPKR